MLNQDQVEKFHRDGFILGGKVLDDAGVDELRAEMHRVISDKDLTDLPQPVRIVNLGKEETPVWQILNICDASKAFKRLVSNPVLTQTISTLMQAPVVRLWHDQIQYKPAATGGVNMWHQDAPYWPVLTPDDQVSAWIALDDVDLDNGCMSMVPGSHLWGDQIDYLHTLKGFDSLPESFEGHEVKIVACPVKKGHVHFHHSLTWHGSSANRSGRPRRAIAVHYMSGDNRYVESGDHVMKPFITAKDGEPIKDDHFELVWPQ